MCLAIPGKIEAITAALDDVFRIGKVSFEGIKKEVNLALVPEAQVGDYVLVHVGAAISVVDGISCLLFAVVDPIAPGVDSVGEVRSVRSGLSAASGWMVLIVIHTR